MKRARWTVATAAVGLLLAGTARADVAMQKKAKELGITSVQNCQSCHVDKMPKKGADKVNEMGQWLVDQKEARKAKEIDVAWLKEYKPKAK
jgi:mono/diheme cytochrome c family protein